MRNFIKTFGAALLLALCIWSPVLAHTSTPAFTVWSPGQGLTATALNDSLAHLHNTFSGGIVDAHISSTAAISVSKLARPDLLPRSWAYTSGATNVPGAILTSGLTTSLTYTRGAGAGVFTYTLSPARPNANYMLVVTGQGIAAAAADNFGCHVRSRTTTGGSIECYNAAGALADPPRLDGVLWDDDGATP